MNSRQLNRSLLLASLLAVAGLAHAQTEPDQRQFTSDKPMEPFVPAVAETSSGSGAAATASGEAGATAAGSSVVEVDGAETRAWVDLQASGTAAVGDARPMPGEVADVVYQRYVNSFKHPIPAQFPRTSGGESGSGSGSGSGSESN